MTSKNKKVKATLIIPLISLLVTIFMLFLLYEDIKALNEGDKSVKRIALTIINSIALFIIPFIFNPKAVKKRFDSREEERIQREKDYLDIIIKKTVKLDETFTPSLIRKCPKCGFMNTGKTKICYNCGFKLNW